MILSPAVLLVGLAQATDGNRLGVLQLHGHCAIVDWRTCQKKVQPSAYVKLGSGALGKRLVAKPCLKSKCYPGTFNLFGFEKWKNKERTEGEGGGGVFKNQRTISETSAHAELGHHAPDRLKCELCRQLQ